MSRRQTPITAELEDYVREVSLREPEPLRRLREETEDHPLANWQISPEQGQFLHLLTRAAGVRKALEIGVLMGYSTTWLALALAPGGKLIACDVSEEFMDLARRTWRGAGVEDRIDFRLGPALETMDSLVADGQAGTFDLVFIDADKTGYEDYFERSLALVRPGGLIVADNVLQLGKIVDRGNQEADVEAIRAFNRKLHADRRVALSLATVGDGLTLAVKL